MPAITILSPYSGQPVKVREQDLGRAVRDEQGRIFYIVEHPEYGRYAARTRKGSDKDLERYQKLQAGTEKLDASSAVQASRSAVVHDATGVKRRNPVGLIALVVILLVLAAGGYYALVSLGVIGSAGTDPNPIEDIEPDQPILPDVPDLAPPTPSLDRSHGPGGLRVVYASNQSQVRPKPYADFSHTASGLRYKKTHRTQGPPARVGSVVSVRYTMTTLDGQALIDDASQEFVLASGEAIRAFDEGLAGVREGEQLRLFIPRGHSSRGALPGIDRMPDQPVLMDVQLVSVRPGVSWVLEKPGLAEARPATPGDRVSIHYVLRVEGRRDVVDATSVRGEPMQFVLGSGEVIRGLDLGLIGMKPGETRTLTIPPYLAYGDQAVAGGLIPADAVLSFRAMMIRVDPPDNTPRAQG